MDDDGEVGHHTLQEVVHAHLDRLRPALRNAGHAPIQSLLVRFDQSCLGLRGAPFRFWLENDEGVALLDPHRVGRDLRTATERGHALNFGEFLQRLLHHGLGGDRGFERDAGQLGGGDSERAFLQAWQKLRAETGADRESAAQHHDRNKDRDPRVPHGPRERRRIAAAGDIDDAAVPLGDRPAQEEGSEHRHQRERQRQRGGQREHHRERHRAEHLALDTLQAEDRQIDQGDDRDRKGDRARHVVRGLAHHLLGRERWRLRATAHDILYHHHRAVDQQTEIDGTEAHQVARKAGEIHGCDGGKHRERNSKRHDEGGAEIAQQYE